MDKTIKNQGLKYDIIVIEEIDDLQYLDDAEIGWISYFKKLGCPLTNLTPGGGGISGYHHTQETKDKVSKARRAWKTTDEARRNMSLAHMGQIPSDNLRLANSLRTKGVKQDPEFAKRRCMAARGTHSKTIWPSLEELYRMRETMTYLEIAQIIGVGQPTVWKMIKRLEFYRDFPNETYKI
jgi:hypothetical protein